MIALAAKMIGVGSRAAGSRAARLASVLRMRWKRQRRPLLDESAEVKRRG